MFDVTGYNNKNNECTFMNYSDARIVAGRTCLSAGTVVCRHDIGNDDSRLWFAYVSNCT
jgi:hypothetical protein